MDEDNDIFDLFLEMMEQIQTDDPNGRLRMLSKNPRYADDSPGYKNKANSNELTPKPRHIERI